MTSTTPGIFNGPIQVMVIDFHAKECVLAFQEGKGVPEVPEPPCVFFYDGGLDKAKSDYP